MRFGSLCSGIEAAGVASAPLGWRAAWFAEIEPFCCALLADKYPDVPNFGDLMGADIEQEIRAAGSIDVLVGGTPCQSFSVAGLRGGLDDARGNLSLRFWQLVDVARPTWVVWENVPGVLSDRNGRTFGSILGAVAKLGYGFAYRILDAQYVRVDGLERAVPQRRRRVFIVGHLGDWRRAAAVLFDSESVYGDSPPRRTAGEGIAAAITRGADSGGAGGYAGRRREDDVNLVAECGSTLNAHYGTKWGLENQHVDSGCPLYVAHSLKSEGADASEDGTGRGTPLVFDERNITSATNRSQPQPGLSHTLHADPPVCFQTRIARNGRGQPKEIADNFLSNKDGSRADVHPHVASRSGVRRLTPLECERLMGFPDQYTAIRYRNKPAADAPRYRALGNSMCVNVMRWIFTRIDLQRERHER